MSITFGTDGWRAVIADQYTFENVRLVAGAIARYLLWDGRAKLDVYHPKAAGASYPSPFRAASAGLVVGYDTRFMGDRFAQAVAEEIAAYGIPVWMSSEHAPTPALSLAVRDRKAVGAVIVTASHNPYQYNGIKFKPEYASSGLPEVMDGIARFVAEPAATPTAKGADIKVFSPMEGYREELRRLVDVERIEKSGLQIVIDPMHGAACTVVPSLISTAVEIRDNPDPRFGGVNPEPIDRNLQALSHACQELGPSAAGIAFDGDADRVGAMDAAHFYNSHEIFAMLLLHLVQRRGWSGGVVKTFSTSHMIGLLAQHFALQVHETPIGFKYIVEHMLEHDILIGGEESGGIGVKSHIPERDGPLSGLLLLEAAAWEKDTLASMLARVHEITGPFAYDRSDLHVSSRDAMARFLEQLKQKPPVQIGGHKVTEVLTLDGVKLELENNCWILFRPSGTEPVLRVYVEARSADQVKAILHEGRDMVTAKEPASLSGGGRHGG